MGFNKLLEKQLRKYLPDTDLHQQEGFKKLLHAISESYESYERDRVLSSHAFSLSEQEYEAINEKLTAEVAVKRKSVQRLFEVIRLYGGTDDFKDQDSADLYAVVDFLEAQLIDKRKSEALLRESEQRMQLALQTVEDNIWEYDFDNRKMIFAQTDRSILKLARKEYVGDENMEWWKTIYEEDLEIAIEIFRKYNRGEINTHSIEYRMYASDGSIKWMLNRGGVIKRNEDGKVIKVVGSITDIDKFKYVQAELSATANRLSNLLASLQNGVLVEDENRRIVMANQKFCEMFAISISPELLVGVDCTTSAEQFKHLFLNPERFVEGINTLLDNQKLVAEEEISLSDGRVFERTYIPIFINNEYKGHLWIYNDITIRKLSETALKRQEERYRNIIANMNLGLIEVGNDDTILYVNHSFSEMSGYAEDELIGKNASSLLLGEGNRGIPQEKQLLREKGISDAYEVMVKDKRGQLKWWLISGAPRYNDDNELVGSIGIHLDITAQKKLEIDLMEAREAAEVSSRAKETFLANMSHEIRTPLSAILGMSRLLRETNLNIDQSRYLDTINKASDHLLVIINDILDISKIDAGMLELESIGFKLPDLIDQVLQLMALKADEKGLELSKDLDPHIARVLIGDPFRLKQVLLNLFSNAIKFTEKGNVNINVHLSTDSEEKVLLTFVVTDTGVGMSQDLQQRIFQNFVQGDKTTARRYGGTGLGMSICKKLVEMMGGLITLESEVGKGTRVSLQIPFYKGANRDIPKVVVENMDLSLLSGSRILVVEDNEVNRFLATIILERKGVAVVSAENGRDAIDILMKESFDLILMDIQMPVLDGFESTGIIRNELGSAVPIIALTANAIRGEYEKCINAGMNGYLSKPFEPDALLNIVTTWLNHKKESAVNNLLGKSRTELYSLKKIEKICNGDKAFVRKMVRLFLDQIPAAVKEMQGAFRKGELGKVSAIAHKIKPTLDNMYISSLYTEIREIEILAKDGNDTSLLEGYISTVDKVIEKVVEQITTDYGD